MGGVALSALRPSVVVRASASPWRPSPELAFLLVVAAALNLCGLTWGLPNVEEWAVDSITPLGPLFYVRQLLTTGHWWAKYPPLHFTLLAALYAPYVAWLVLTGSLQLGAGVAHYPYGLSQPEAMLSVFTLIGRVLSVGMGVGTAVGAYLIARELGGRVAGLIAGLLFACSPLAIYYAHTANLDIPYMFWSSLALLCLVRVVRGAERRTYVWLGVFAAAAIATKDQAYALFLLLPIPLATLHVRRDGRRGLFDRRLLAGFAAAVATYLIAANVLVDASSWFRHVYYITHEGSIPYRMFPATLGGYLQLAGRTLHWIIASAGVPGAALGACGLVWALARRVPGAGVLALAGISSLVLFLGPILYVLPRFVLPAVFVLAVFGGLAGSWLCEMRRLPARAAVALVLTYALAYGVTMDLGLLWDSRYAAEEWMAHHLPPTALVGTDGESVYLPRLPNGVRVVPVTMTADGPVAAAAAPDYLILSDAHYRRYLRRPAMRPVVEKLLRGELEYQPVAVFHQSGLPATELIPAVNPRIVILRRRDRAGNVS